MIFKVKGQCHRVKFLLRNILVKTRINILQWILTKLGTYLDRKRIWNPIDFQGQRSRSQDLISRQGIRYALRCPCFYICLARFTSLRLCCTLFIIYCQQSSSLDYCYFSITVYDNNRSGKPDNCSWDFIFQGLPTNEQVCCRNKLKKNQCYW